MKQMARTSTRKPHSWWWDSHISPKNSKWLADNLEEMDCCVKEMLKLIEDEGDSFAKKAELYYQRRPELVSHVEGFYRMYRALAERYDHLTGELRRNIPSKAQSQGSGGSSDHSAKGSDGSSFSESDLDSDDSKDGNEDDSSSSALHRRILELENQLSDAKEKLHDLGDHVDCSSRISASEKALIVANEKIQIAEAEILRLKQNLVQEVEELNSVLEVETSLYQQEIKKQQLAFAASTHQFQADLSHRNQEIEEQKITISRLSEALSQEAIRHKGEAVKLGGVIEDLKLEIEETSQEKSLLEAKVDHMLQELETNAASSAERFLRENSAMEVRVSDLSQSHASLEAKIELLEGEIERLEAESMKSCAEKRKHIEELNENLFFLKVRADTLEYLNEDFSAKVSMLLVGVKYRDGRIDQLIADIEEKRMAGDELRSRVKELEEEVERQRAVISDSAEGKREAIRQLCFSIEHYRDGYHRLREVLQWRHGRPAVMAS